MRSEAARKKWSVVAVLAAMAAAVLDAGMVNVALPSLGRALEVSPATATMVLSAYQLAVLMGLLPCAHLADRLGHRRLFLGGIATFSMASLSCAVAPSIEGLAVLRFVQGLGAAAIMSLGIALLRAALGTDRLTAAIAWNALTVAICSAAGPTLGAVLLEFGSWHWIFVAGLPLSALSIGAAWALPEGGLQRGNIDVVGVLLLCAAAALIFLAFEGSMTEPLLSLLLVSIGAVCIAALARRDTNKPRPVVPFDLLADTSFRHSLAASVCCFIAQATGMVMLPFHLEMVLGRNALAAGLVLASWPIAVAAASLAANRFIPDQQRAWQGPAGATLLMAGLLISAVLPTSSTAWLLAGAASICGAGFGLFQLANNRSLFLTAPEGRSAAAGGMQGTARLTGQTAGTLLASLVFHSVPLVTAAPRTGFLIAAGFGLIAALVSASGRTPISPESSSNQLEGV